MSIPDCIEFSEAAPSPRCRTTLAAGERRYAMHLPPLDEAPAGWNLGNPDIWTCMSAIIGGIAAAALLILLAGCTAAAKTDVGKATPPAEIARAVCTRSHPRDIAACPQLRLPSRASEIAYRTCIAYDRIDPRRCDNLRRAYEAELRAYPTSARSAASDRAAATEGPPPLHMDRARLQALRHTARELYDATSKDAQTFAAARLIPEVRQRIERALHQQLSNDVLNKLAIHAQAEALYWYEYMQGLDKLEKRSNLTTFSGF